MASEGAGNISVGHKESSAVQPDAFLADEQAIISTDATSEQDVGSDDENVSDDSGNVSNSGGHMKLAAEAVLAGVRYEFGWSKVNWAHIMTLENSFHFFLKGFARPLGIESVPDPKENEVVVFEDFFTDGLRMPPHPVLLDILHKFQEQLYQLTPNAIIQTSKFIWAVTSY
jgi:hypothetical protein